MRKVSNCDKKLSKYFFVMVLLYLMYYIVMVLLCCLSNGCILCTRLICYCVDDAQTSERMHCLACSRIINDRCVSWHSNLYLTDNVQSFFCNLVVCSLPLIPIWLCSFCQLSTCDEMNMSHLSDAPHCNPPATLG